MSERETFFFWRAAPVAPPNWSAPAACLSFHFKAPNPGPPLRDWLAAVRQMVDSRQNAAGCTDCIFWGSRGRDRAERLGDLTFADRSGCPCAQNRTARDEILLQLG
jgi:hypothetical protein